jgi:hypothetical protein
MVADLRAGISFEQSRLDPFFRNSGGMHGTSSTSSRF